MQIWASREKVSSVSRAKYINIKEKGKMWSEFEIQAPSFGNFSCKLNLLRINQ